MLSRRAWLIIAVVIYLYEGFTLVSTVRMLTEHHAENNTDQDQGYELSSLEENDGGSYREILPTDSTESSKRKLKNILRIFRSKTEVARLLSEYKFLALSCSLAVIGLIITIRMVGSQENFVMILHFLLSLAVPSLYDVPALEGPFLPLG